MGRGCWCRRGSCDGGGRVEGGTCLLLVFVEVDVVIFV